MNGSQQETQIQLQPLKFCPPMRTKQSRQRRRKTIDLYLVLTCVSAILLITPSVVAFSSHSFSTTTATHRAVVPKLLYRRPLTHHLYSSQRANHPEPAKLQTVLSSLSNVSQRVLAAIHSSPWLQLVTVFVFYTFHLVYLTQRQLVFPIQWWASPNSNEWRAYRHFVGIGYDSLVGMATLAVYYKKFRSQAQQAPPVLVPKTMPWKFPPAPSSRANATATTINIIEAVRSQYSWPHVVHRATFLLTSICLVTAYFATGRFSAFWQDKLYELSARGFPLTTPQFRAWSVLLGHLSWVGVGSGLLYLIPFAPRFFRRQGYSRETSASNVPEENGKRPRKPWHWFRFQFSKPRNGKSVWVWWTLGGYFVSCWLFNVADWANHYLLPEAVLQSSTESVVSQLVAPEFNDRAASLIGYIAPCLSAPLWEELLYRGFLLSGLWSCLFRHNFSVAAVVQAIVFSAHHMSLAAALPLAVLGYAWAVLYGLSGNLWTVCLVHSLWNSRVFLSSWLGL